MQGSIKGQTLQIKSGLNIIKGNFVQEDISLKNAISQDWSEFLEQFLNQDISYFEFFLSLAHEFNITNKFDKELNSNSPWNQFLLIEARVKQIQEEYQDLKLKWDYFTELSELHVQLQKLNQQQELLKNLNSNQILKAKQEMLEKINNQIDMIKPRWQLISDEYQSYEIRMDQLQKSLTTIESNNVTQNTKQKENFKETNLLTKKIDELEEQLQVYEEKLFDSKQLNLEDKERITQKADKIKQEIQLIKAQRIQKMEESKNIQQNSGKNQKELKTIKETIKNFTPKYSESKEQFQKINAQMESLINQKNSILQELQIQIQEKSTENSQEKSEPSQVNRELEFNSANQIIEKIQEVNRRIQYINSILQSENKQRIEDKVMKLKNELVNANEEKKLIKFTGFSSELLKLMLESLKKFITIMNQFLAPIDLVLKAIIDQDSQGKTQIQFNYSTKLKHKEFNIQSDLTRNIKAQIEVAIIFALHIAFNHEIILNTNTIPEPIATKKTFTKALQSIEEIIEHTPELNKIPRVIIDPKNIVENDATQIIE